MSIVKGEYSIWTASMWWTLQARRREVDETSERPKYLIFPSLYNTFVSLVVRLGEGIARKMGEVGVLLFQFRHNLHRLLDGRHTIHPMAIIQINTTDA